MKYEIKHRYSGAVLFSLECGSLKLCIAAAVSAKTDLSDADLSGATLSDANLSGADLSGANLYGADLSGADLYGANLTGANLIDANLRGTNLTGANLRGTNLTGANLRGAYLIDGGQDRRGFIFWAWRKRDGTVVYRAGCHEWENIADALAWYGDSYASDGDRAECLARLALLHSEALSRWTT